MNKTASLNIPRRRITMPAFATPLMTILLVTMPFAWAQESSKKTEDILPGAPRLLPSDTLVYVRLDNAETLRVELGKSSTGLMLKDPKLKPFANQFYATASELFDQISDVVGVNLDQLLAIPNGQVAFAIHPAKPLDEDERPKFQARENEDEDRARRRRERDERRQLSSFGMTLIVDAGDEIDSAMTMVDRLEKAMINGGFKRRVRKIGSTDVIRLIPNRTGREPLEYFEKKGTLVMGVGNSAAQDVLNHWIEESDEPTLAENAAFGTLMSRCIGAESTRPQLTFFVDPHAIVDRIIKRSDSIAVGLVWPVIEDMGAARIGGIGGSSFTGGELFEGIAHYHIKVDPPRDGVLGVLRPETGETVPPNWVPEDVAGYTSLTWDFEQAYENLGKVLDRFQGADALKRLVEAPIKKRLGVDIKEDVLGNITGRLLRVTWMEPPIRLNSSVSAAALELSDPVKAKSVLASIRDRMPDALKIDSVSGNVVYRMRSPGGDRFPKTLRRPEPSLMILGDWLIYADSTKFLEKVALANAGNLPRLVTLPEYDLVAGELGGKLGGEKPFVLSFIDGAQGMRLIYDLARDQNSQKFMKQVGERNIVAKKFAELLDTNELPPFSEFEKYFAPTGFFGYDEPDGMHFGFFTLRADPDVE